MRFLDLMSLPLAALWQQKMRTVLTTLGVVFGSFVLAASLSIGQGVQSTIDRIAQRNDMDRQIHVNQGWKAAKDAETDQKIEVPGDMSEERKQRLRVAIGQQNPGARREPVELTPERIKELATIPHVKLVIPVVHGHGFAILGNRSQSVHMASSRPDSLDGQRRIVAGRFFQSAHEPSVVVKEHLLYQLGLTNDADLNAAVGRKLRIEFRPTRNEGGITVDLIKADRAELTRDESALLAKIRARLPATVPSLGLTTSELLILKNALSNETSVLPEPIYREYTIAGVQRDGTPEEMEEANRRAFQWLNSDSPVTLPYQTAIDLMQKLFKGNTVGLEHAVVFVDSPQHSKDVVKAINDLGLNAYAPLEHIERERLMYLLIFGGMTCIAAIALLVAALGIANTMLMSVLERTREIGIMKSVGAGNGTLQFLFLVEGALIGLLGGGLGLLAAWGASFPGDAYIRSLVTNDLKINLDQSIFVFPPWLAMTVLTFAVLVTTLAAVSPARRAARIDPVRALRHE